MINQFTKCRIFKDDLAEDTTYEFSVGYGVRRFVLGRMAQEAYFYGPYAFAEFDNVDGWCYFSGNEFCVSVSEEKQTVSIHIANLVHEEEMNYTSPLVVPVDAWVDGANALKKLIGKTVTI